MGGVSAEKPDALDAMSLRADSAAIRQRLAASRAALN